MTDHQNKDNTENFRSTVAQFLCTIAFCTLVVNIGLILGMPTIVIGALREESTPLGLSESQASWVGSIIFLSQPFGCAISGFIQDTWGRKHSLLLITVPQLLAWIIMYFSTSLVHIYVAVAIMGVAVGCLEAPILSYVGEITQPRLRGILFSFVGISFNLGITLETFIGSLVTWRKMVLISMIGPVLAFIAMCLVPDSPVWLIAKGRTRDAEMALQWLRGWVKLEAIKEEFEALVSYVKENNKVKVVNSEEYTAVPSKEERFSKIKHRRWWHVVCDHDVLTAFRIIILYFCASACTSLISIRPFLLEILVGLNSPVKPHLVVTICGCLTMLGSVTQSVCVRPLGKRRLTFLSMGLSIFCCLGMSAYLLLHLDFPWVPVILLYLTYYITAAGIVNIPWLLIVELIPLRARGVGSGICAALAYILMFFVAKTYYSLVSLVTVSGTFVVYGVLGLLVLIYLYFDMPETEGVSLEVIQRRLSERRSISKQASTKVQETRSGQEV